MAKERKKFINIIKKDDYKIRQIDFKVLSDRVRAFNERIRYIKEGKKADITKESDEFKFLQTTKEYENLVKSADRFRKIADAKENKAREWAFPYTEKQLKYFYKNASSNDIRDFEKLFVKYEKMNIFNSRVLTNEMNDFNTIKTKYKDYIGEEYTNKYNNAKYLKWFTFNALIDAGLDSEQAYELVYGSDATLNDEKYEMYLLDLLSVVEDNRKAEKKLTTAELYKTLETIQYDYMSIID